jgi:membrane fusion protein, multidrug efflux system
MSEAKLAETPAPLHAVNTDEAPRSTSKRNWILAIGSLAAVALAGTFWLHSRHFEDTDDAQVDGDISAVSPRVNGSVIAVHVVDNQEVKKGDLLVEIDPRDFQVAVSLAKANVEQAEAQLSAEMPSVEITDTSNRTSLATTSEDVTSARAELAEAKSTLEQLGAQLVQAEANDRYAQSQLVRGKQLFADQVIPASDLDQRSSAADASAANVQALRKSVAAAEQRASQKQARIQVTSSRLEEIRLNGPRTLDARKATLAMRKAALDAARAQLEQAELNLAYTKVLAPVDGIVGKKSVNVGDRVQPGQQLLAVTQIDRLWITANFRETQLAHMKPGQRAKVYVDATGRDIEGTVVSMAAATGARFSLLPPENATGNYVKVVQRVPVRIALDDHQPGMDRLRPGMSVEPKVRVR